MLVAIARNNPDNGMPLDRATAVEVDECEWDCCFDPPPVFRILDSHRFRLGRRVFRFRDRRVWYGNWCWDGFDMETTEALRLVGWIEKLGWTCMAAVDGSPFGDGLHDA